MGYIVFAVLSGIPDRSTLKVFRDKNKVVALGHAKHLCHKMDINVEDRFAKPVDELEINDFKIGVGLHDNTVYIWEADVY